MLDRLGALPEPQRAALGVALGLSSGDAPDRFLVALAALTLLAEVAAERPLLCVVDDAQWLDAASAQVLGFVGRRLLAESVAIVFAVREPSEARELVGLPELELAGLPEEDARALLATVIPGRLDERVRDRLVAEARGNPLAILELPRGLAPTQLPGGLGLLEAQALPRRIEESVLRRLDALPEEARLLLLLVAAEAGKLDELQRARVDRLHAEVAYAQNRGRDAPQLLLRAARRLEPLDVRLSRDTYLDSWSAALFAGRLASAGSLLDVSRAVRTAPEPPPPPRPCDLLLDGFALVFTEGRPAATPVLQRAATAFGGAEVSMEEVLRWGWLATAAAAYVWDYDTCLAVATREVQLARDAGALEVLAVGVNVLGQAAALGGDFARAALLVAEADAVTEATGTRVAPYGALVLAAFRGHEAAASKLIGPTIEHATAGGQGTAVQYAHWANAVVMNGLGRYEEALAAAFEASEDTPELFVAAWALSELIEAASRTGQTEVAARALARLGEDTRGSETEWALGIQARSCALLSEGEAAESLYREAIDRFGRTRLRPELARS